MSFTELTFHETTIAQTMEGVFIIKGIVSNIQRFSIHDGPGIRTTVFLKGCNLRCFWCHNPETFSPRPELQIFPQKCINCGKCLELCPINAHQIKDGERIFRRDLCDGCGKCAETCYAEALVMVGEEMNLDEVMEELAKDQPFYEQSNGGVTFSGGEALLQKDFLRQLLIESKKRGFHTTIDTAGNVPWQSFEDILPYVDLFLYDIKAIDDDKHRKGTGVSNKLILDNIKKLGMTGADIWIRIPVIPGFNDDIDEMDRIGDFIKGLEGISMVELLPFHRFGQNKYESLGMDYRAREIQAPSDESMDVLREVLIMKVIIVK